MRQGREWFRTSLMLVGLAPWAAAVAAGGERRVEANPQVRVWMASAPSGEPIVGRLVATDESALWVSLGRRAWGVRGALGVQEAETLRLPREAVRRLEASPRPSRKKLGATIGAVVGFVAGVILVESHRSDDPGAKDACTGCGIAAGLVALPFAGVGALVAPGADWKPADPRTLSLGQARRPAGSLGVRLSWRF